MNLLCERKQSTAVATLVPLQFGGGVMFTLWVKAELDAEEKELLKKYRFQEALLVADESATTLRDSMRSSVPFAFVIWLVLFQVVSWSNSLIAALIAFFVITGIYYNELRTDIYVRDLVHGRKFRCFSIVGLIRKEHELLTWAAYLRQVLESAKNWDGREVLEVPPLTPELAKQLVIEGP